MEANMLAVLISLALTLAFAVILAFTVTRNNDISILWELQMYCKRRQYGRLQRLLLYIGNAFISQKDKRKQRKIGRLVKAYVKDFDTLHQRSLYLQQEDRLLKKKALAGCLDQDEIDSQRRIKQKINEVFCQMWKNANRFTDTYTQFEGGAWVRDYIQVVVPTRYSMEGQDLECYLRLGCCYRGCGCCLKDRWAEAGIKPRITNRPRGHCSVECGCCIAWRGFRLPGEETKETESDWSEL